MSLKDIDKFENQNDCGICVITWDKENGFGIASVCEKDIDKSKIVHNVRSIKFCHHQG